MAAVDTLNLEGLTISSSSVPEDGLATPHPTTDAESPLRCPVSGAHAEDGAPGVCPVTGQSELPKGDPDMQEVDPELLRTSIQTRMSYLKDFLGFRRHDQEMLNKVAPLIYETIPSTVDQLYSKLFEFDVTKQVR